MKKFNTLEDEVVEAFKSFLQDLYSDPRLEEDIIHVTTLTGGLPTQRWLSQKLLKQGVEILPDLESSYSATIGIIGHSIFESLYRKFWEQNKYAIPEVPLRQDISSLDPSGVFKYMVGTSDIIQIVKLEDDGTLVVNIRDWKTTKKYAASHKKEQLLNGEDVPWAWQLNIYKYMLENANKKELKEIKSALIHSLVKAVYKTEFFAHFNNVKKIDEEIAQDSIKNGVSHAVQKMAGLLKNDDIIEKAEKIIDMIKKTKRIKVDDLGIIMILSDWSKSPWANRNTNEKSPITAITVPIMPDNRIKLFLEKKVAQFAHPENYTLTEEDLWIKLFALYDDNTKKIYKTFTLKELKDFVNNGTLSSGQKIIFIGERYIQDPNKIKRCQYCSIKSNCGQKPALDFIRDMGQKWYAISNSVNKKIQQKRDVNKIKNNENPENKEKDQLTLEL